MRAAVVEALDIIIAKEMPEPECVPGSLKIKIHTCAVCGSDIGHEIAGEASAGSNPAAALMI